MLPDLSPMALVMLLVLGYALITAVLTVLSYQAEHQISRHELLRQTRTRRLRYELSLIKRQQELRADIESDVEILDDPPPRVVGQVKPPAESEPRQAA